MTTLTPNILVIKLRHHGDVLLCTAFLRHLRNQFPQAQIDCLIYQETLALLQHNDHVNQIWTIDRNTKGWERLKKQHHLIKSIQNQNYHFIFHQTDQWIGAIISYLCPKAVRIGFLCNKRKSLLWQKAFTHLIPQPTHNTVHACAQNFLLLKPIALNPIFKNKALHSLTSIEDPTPQNAPCHLPVPKPIEAQAGEILKNNGITNHFVLIHPSARWGFKCWEEERFAQVIDFLVRQGLQVLLTSGPDPTEVAMVQCIEQHLGENTTPGQVLNLAGQVNLPLIAAFLKRCKLYIGVDSAPMHMAAALNVPQVCLFGSTRIQEWRPWSDCATLIYAGDYGTIPSPDGLNTNTTERYLKPILTETVIQAIKAQLNI